MGLGRRGDDRPVVITGVWGLAELADAVGVPMGLELLPPPEATRSLHPGFQGYSVAGLPLRHVLAMLSALDPRYEWRDVGGVIVFRPVNAWHDPENPLFQLIGDVKLSDATMSEAVGTVTSRLGSTVHGNARFPDTRRVTVDLAQGSVLELLNAVAAAHGQLCWTFETLSVADQRFMGGRRHRITFSPFGGGAMGFAVP